MIVKIANFLKTINLILGKTVAWTTLFMVLIIDYIIIKRALLHEGSIAIQESVGYLHAFLILFGIAYAYQKCKHVKVDVIYGHFSKKTKRNITIISHLLFAIPSSLTLMYFTYGYSYHAWQIQEASREAGGLQYLYIIKVALFLMPALIFLEALSQLLSLLGESK